ncbi:hypothetical protein EK904_009620, partial [Melospiza melodia maxima]
VAAITSQSPLQSHYFAGGKVLGGTPCPAERNDISLGSLWCLHHPLVPLSWLGGAGGCSQVNAIL